MTFIGAAVGLLLVGWLFHRKDKEMGRLDAELTRVRTYETDRNFRCQLSMERDDADRDNIPLSFEEAYGRLGYTVEELHLMADQGSIEASGGWPSYSHKQEPEHIENGRAHRERRATALRQPAEKIARLEAKTEALERYDEQRNMRCLMSFDRDEADVGNDSSLFESYWSASGYSREMLNMMADQGYLEAQGQWPGPEFQWKPEHRLTMRKFMAKRAEHLRQGSTVAALSAFWEDQLTRCAAISLSYEKVRQSCMHRRRKLNVTSLCEVSLQRSGCFLHFSRRHRGVPTSLNGCMRTWRQIDSTFSLEKT